MGSLNPIAGEQTLTVSTTAVSLTVPARAHHALVTSLDSSGTVRFLDNGVAPTTTKGVQLQPGDALDLTDMSMNYRPVLLALRFIREDAANGTLEVTYYD